VKTLLVLRHGKSSWADASLADHDRPLKKRGRRGATSIGRQLVERDLVPALTLCSTARRARDTASLCLKAAGGGERLELTRELYATGVDHHLEVVATAAGEADERVMIVGHNPDLEQLVARLTGEPARLKTAFLAVIELELERWAEIGGEPRGRLHAVLEPAR
jgi:phosphohistidine phosphatase